MMKLGHAPSRQRFAAACAAALLCAAAVVPARADERVTMPAIVPTSYVQECGACHLAYPPGLLPARSWQRLMSGLDRHYGNDAALDPATVQLLSGWLQANAATARKQRAEPPEDRITRADWFVREHRKVDRAVWTDPAVKSAANCAACHAGAERGSFDERDLRAPPGLAPKWTRSWRD